MRPWYKRGLPGWIVSGGGGGGLSSVSVTARLSGNGTAGSPLDIAGLPLTFVASDNRTDFDFGVATANQVAICGFVLPYALTLSHIGVNVHIADAVNSYDVGLYTKAGTLIANIGPISLPATGLRNFPTNQAAQTIAPGLYIMALTGNATTGKLQASSAGSPWVYNGNVASSAAGTLPASIAAQSVAPSVNMLDFSLF